VSRPEGPAPRVAFVTGAARGIGAATVRRLLDDGYAVTALDCCADAAAGVRYPLATQADLDRVAGLDRERVLALAYDVRDRTLLDAAVTATVERFGRLDAVVAAAGVVAGGALQWETPDEQLRTLLEVNAVGVWNTAAATVPAMLTGPAPDRCRFVAIASAAGEHGLHRLAAYGASKHAVIGIVRGLAADLAGTGVTAVAVAPGSTDTAMLAATADLYGASVEELAQRQSLQRLLTPDEIAATVALCCSPAGAALNGAVVRADGGFRG
jgi:SDR family mycofactocin-dependent oxidoreductase